MVAPKRRRFQNDLTWSSVKSTMPQLSLDQINEALTCLRFPGKSARKRRRVREAVKFWSIIAKLRKLSRAELEQLLAYFDAQGVREKAVA